MTSPWIIRTLTLPPLLASLIPRSFPQYHTPTTYLPQNSHHTYLLWHLHSRSEVYCHATFHRSVYMAHITFFILLFAWTCSWHCICGKPTVHNSFIHVTLDSLHIIFYCILVDPRDSTPLKDPRRELGISLFSYLSFLKSWE